MNKITKPKVIAFYLPQYHRFHENDEWWGKGFTEWTNVARAKPLYKGHNQPKIPADLGFYDLRLPSVGVEQAELAKEAGIYGFCYWHYWFGEGKQLMSCIFDNVLSSGAPNFPFCLGWANHSWYAKNWNSNDAGRKDKLLIEQKYPGDDDIRKHYEYALNAFKDTRYIKKDGKPVFLIYKPIDIPGNFIESWNKWAKEDGFEGGIYFIARYVPKDFKETESQQYIDQGFSAVLPERFWRHIYMSKKHHFLYKIKLFFYERFSLGIPSKFKYSEIFRYFTDSTIDKDEHVIPTLIPNFDHSPRSKKAGYILDGACPSLFGKLCRLMFKNIQGKENDFVWLKSWNEWGEGNYMEPDLQFGKGFIHELRNSLDEIRR